MAELRVFDLNELDEVSTDPGVYAWYAVPVIGPNDLLDVPGQPAAARIATLLADHSRRLRHPELKMATRSTFSASWSGALPEAGMNALATNLEALATGAASPQRLAWALQQQDRRTVTSTLLSSATQLLSAPIYIGVATDLQDRLKQHVASYEAAAAAGGGAVANDLKDSFGFRAYSAGLALDHLRVAVCPVELTENLPEPDLRKLAEAVEYVLNRWNRPILGRR